MYPLDYPLCNAALLWELSESVLALFGCLSIAHRYSSLYKYICFFPRLFMSFLNSSTHTHTHAGISSWSSVWFSKRQMNKRKETTLTWKPHNSLSLITAPYQVLFNSFILFIRRRKPSFPCPCSDVREHDVPNTATLFSSHLANFHWCQPTFSQCLSSLLPLDLLLVVVSALSFCFALR